LFMLRVSVTSVLCYPQINKNNIGIYTILAVSNTFAPDFKDIGVGK